MWILWAPDFNPIKNFIRILNFNYSFEVDVNVSKYNSRKFIEVTNNSDLILMVERKHYLDCCF